MWKRHLVLIHLAFQLALLLILSNLSDNSIFTTGQDREYNVIGINDAEETSNSQILTNTPTPTPLPEPIPTSTSTPPTTEAQAPKPYLNQESEQIHTPPLSTQSPVQKPTIQPKPAPTSMPTPAPTPAPTPVPAAGGTKVVGYYAAWSAYSDFNPDKIDASKLTHINYAFANIGSDLRIKMGYPDIDPSNFSKLNALKKANPHIKTLISVGGWSWSGKFSDVALTDESRTAFADSCVDFIVEHGFDGVDIDWEYPVSGGMSGNSKRPEDKQNFTLLMQKLRQRLDARGLIDGKRYLLTFAGASGSWYLDNVELEKLHQYVDFGNIMTYDIHATWDKYTDLNAPLYNNSDYSPQKKWSVDASVKAWLKAGFPSNKLIMGVPFYGYRYTSVSNKNNGLYQTHTGGSSVAYSDLAANYLSDSGYLRYFSNESMVPWLFNGSTFISYDDEQSMGLKAQYIKNSKLGGAMIWELSQDPNRVLLNALYQNLK